MLSKLLLSLSLAVAPAVSVSAQAQYTEFDTFQTADKYLADFDYLCAGSFMVRNAGVTNEDDFESFLDDGYYYYGLPLYYDVAIYNDDEVDAYLYYQSNDYQFWFFLERNYTNFYFIIGNYNGNESLMRFIELDAVGMSQVIEHDKTEKSNSISIYNSFYNFFTGFFPNEVVAEYHGIFTFIIVAFLLFLVFGFVFFLFRVIRRLVGFK